MSKDKKLRYDLNRLGECCRCRLKAMNLIHEYAIEHERLLLERSRKVWYFETVEIWIKFFNEQYDCRRCPK